jgi:hypothetical protein
MSRIPFELSTNLSHTWIVDLDGTILKCNYPPYDNDELLPGVKELWAEIPSDDYILIMTARDESNRASALALLDREGLRYNHAIFGVEHGERIVLNDIKPQGLHCAIAWNIPRDQGF